MLHKWSLPARWFHFFACPSGTSRSFTPDDAPERPSPPPRPRPVPGTQDYWLALVSCSLPESAWSALEAGLRRCIRTRAYWGQTGLLWPDERPDAPPAWVRFGVHGEALVPQTRQAVVQRLLPELKRAVHTLEAPDLARLERQCRLLMHGARLGQLYRDLGRRTPQQTPLEELCRALAALLA